MLSRNAFCALRDRAVVRQHGADVCSVEHPHTHGARVVLGQLAHLSSLLSATVTSSKVSVCASASNMPKRSCGSRLPSLHTRRA